MKYMKRQIRETESTLRLLGGSREGWGDVQVGRFLCGVMKSFWKWIVIMMVVPE